MHIGCCTSLADLGKLAALGFEFAELPVSALKPEAGEDEFATIKAAILASATPVRAFNVFLPGDLRVTGPNVDEKRLQSYAAKAIERIHAVGGRVLVFGSGGARNIPDGFPWEQGLDQFAGFARTVGEIAQNEGVVVGLEAINRGEKTNILNTIDQAAEMARRVNHPAVKIIADVYHMALENEPFAHISELKDWIVHIHLADAPKRLAPGLEQLPWAEAFGQLHKAGYDGLMSYECRWDDMAVQAPASIAFVRKIWGK